MHRAAGIPAVISAESVRLTVSEFAFELELCATLEVERDAVVARQLGGGVAVPGGRVLDAVLVEPGPSFDERAAITDETIPADAIDADLGPGKFRPVTDAINARPDRARSVAERAAEVGFVELDRRCGRQCARQVARYPSDWFVDIVGVENKPDLGSPGALRDQLRTDVSLGLLDRVVLATGSYVTDAHRNRIPDDVGIWRYHRDERRLEVVREPRRLPTDDYGVELLERHPGRADVAVVTPSAKASARRRIAERAYGKGWRTFELPPCDRISAGTCHGAACLPQCAWKDRIVRPASECGPDCAGFEPADPPSVDRRSERAARTPWVADPPGRQRTQTGLDRF